MPDNATTINANNILENVNNLIEEIKKAAEEGQAAHHVEQSIFTFLLQMGLQLLTLFFQTAGMGDEGESVDKGEKGGKLVRFPKPAIKRYGSIFGDIMIPRWVYGKRAGQKAKYRPLDAKLKLPTKDKSYLLQEWSQSLATKMPYNEVNGILGMILNLSFSTHTLKRNNQTLSQSVSDFHKDYPAAPVAKDQEIIVSSADGKGVPMRTGNKKMSLVASVYTVAPHVRTAEEIVSALFYQDTETIGQKKRPHPIEKRVRATLKRDDEGTMQPSMKAMFSWISTEIEQRDPENIQPHIFLMDGQASLWEEAEKRKPKGYKTIEILDLLHATGYLWKAAEQFHNLAEKKNYFVRFYTTILLKGHIDKVISSLEMLADEQNLTTNSRKEVEKVCTYFRNNRKRMHYDQYLKAGYPIASGVIEGACRYVVKDRMERSGMRWTMDGAQSMLELRCIELGDNWQNYMSFHIKKENKRLYGIDPNEAANDEIFEFQLSA